MITFSVKFVNKNENSQISIEETIIIKDLNKYLVSHANYEGNLCSGVTSLKEDVQLQNYINLGMTHFDYKPKGSSLSLLVIPNGFWINGLEKKNLTFTDTDTLEIVTDRLLKEYKHQSTSWLQMFNDRMPIFYTNETKVFTLKQLNFKSGDNLYIDFCSNSLAVEEKYKILNASEAFRNAVYWKAPETQTNASISCFLSCVKALHLFFNNFTFYASHFFEALNRFYPFPPAVYSFYRFFRSNVMNIDRLIVIRSLFYWMVYVNGKVMNQAENNNIFKNFNLWLFSIFKSVNFLNDSVDVFIEIELFNKANSYIADPVYFKDTVKDKCDLKLFERGFEPAYDIKALISIVRDSGIKDFLIQFAKPKLSSNLLEYKIDGKLKNLSDEIVKSHWCRFLAYSSKEILSEFPVCNSLALEGEKTVVIENKFKGKKSSIIYHVFNADFSLSVDRQPKDFDSFQSLQNKGLSALLEGIDTRPVDQIDVIILDYSGSMSGMLPLMDKKQTKINKFDAAVIATTCFIDKLNCYDFSHAVGLIKFNTAITIESDITRNHEKIAKDINMVKPDGGTNLWIAIEEGVNMIKKFRNDYEKENRKNNFTTHSYFSRILCLTDGGDTSGKEANYIAEILVKENIIFDCISIDVKQNTDDFRRLQALAFSTKLGYCVWSGESLPVLTKTISKEAFLSVRQRPSAKKNGTYVQHLEEAKAKNIPVQEIKIQTMPMTGKAVKSKEFSESELSGSKVVSMIRPKRILHEFKKVSKLDPKVTGFQFYMDETNFDFWRVIYTPPNIGIPFYKHNESEKRYWLLSIKFPIEYPEKPPEMRFITPFFHPNINSDGRICHEILTKSYSPAVNLTDVITEVNSMIYEPNADDPLDEEAAELYKDYVDKKEKAADVTNHEYLIKAKECFNKAWVLATLKAQYYLMD